MMMKNSVCQSLGTINMLTSDQPQSEVQKAIRIGGASAKVGVTPKATNEAYAKQPSSSGNQQKGMPVGTVRSGKDGASYKKTSSNPSVWVRVATGTVHHEAGGEEQ